MRLCGPEIQKEAAKHIFTASWLNSVLLRSAYEVS